MRSLLATLVLAATLLIGASPAHSEKRIFIIPNQADGYGVDRCLASSAACGGAAAAAYCKLKDFKTATSYRKVDRDEITGAVPVSGSACGRGGCDAFVAIECAR